MKIKLTTFDVGVRRGQIDFVFTLSKLIFNDTIIVSKVEIFRFFHFVLFYNFIDKSLRLESKQGGRGQCCQNFFIRNRRFWSDLSPNSPGFWLKIAENSPVYSSFFSNIYPSNRSNSSAFTHYPKNFKFYCIFMH